MGNVPGKEEQRRRSNLGVSSQAVRDILNPSASYRKKRASKDKEASKEEAMRALIVRPEDNVDGGYLAPYGVYTPYQDYCADIVRRLIVERKLAPFYMPLEDFEEDWDDAKLLEELKKLPLHAPLPTTIEEGTPLDPSSKHYKKQLAARLFERQLLEKRIELQNEAQHRYDRARAMAEKGFRKEIVPSDDLLLRLYKTAKECPICFVYYPLNMNETRCCVHPICLECFVQIKRMDPHPPHDENGSEATEAGARPKDLILEPSKCPFCAMPNFGVTYTPPRDLRVGLGGIQPCDYKADAEPQAAEASKRRNLLPPEHKSVVKTDDIRPDWERKLASARMKLARRSAAATAIHASSLLMNETGSGERREVGNESGELEQRMIEEALRLSLLEEEERKRNK